MRLYTCAGALILLLSFIACSTKTDKAQAPRPNIVVVMCDDLGYADVGFNGSTDIKTPALDQLANEGMKFTSAYVIHPFCGPSCAGLMVGI
ncbi:MULTISPECIES: sulfatase-like hydrolase/transferase [unclassified Saccharicrinis]|uniref:sulfatase-like hydrolase/transferase n=1 Tax=unclassified Saccharicrinis TaxID=2646859 RepID=UPI003D33120C